jgi:hypothetical protein
MIPPPTIRNSLVAQLSGSKRMTWTIYLTGKVFQALKQDGKIRDSKIKGYIGWIDNFEQKFTTVSQNHPSLADLGDRLLVHIEVNKFT